MGIRPVLERQPDFPEEVLAAAMSAYYGGRAECRIRKVEVPVSYVDFLSMYTTVNALMGLWGFVVANRIEVEDATEETRRFLGSITLDDCFRPKTWPQLTTRSRRRPTCFPCAPTTSWAGPGTLGSTRSHPSGRSGSRSPMLSPRRF
jgi:hypothetical protein